jgi:hypothetical protein
MEVAGHGEFGIEFEPGEFVPAGAAGGAGLPGAAEPAELGPASWAYAGALPGHTDHVLCLTAHPTVDRLAASGGKDRAVMLWDVASGEALRKLAPKADPLDLLFGRGSSDGSLIGAIDKPGSHHASSGELSVWDVESGATLCVGGHSFRALLRRALNRGPAGLSFQVLPPPATRARLVPRQLCLGRHGARRLVGRRAAMPLSLRWERGARGRPPSETWWLGDVY